MSPFCLSEVARTAIKDAFAKSGCQDPVATLIEDAKLDLRTETEEALLKALDEGALEKTRELVDQEFRSHSQSSHLDVAVYERKHCNAAQLREIDGIGFITDKSIILGLDPVGIVLLAMSLLVSIVPLFWMPCETTRLPARVLSSFYKDVARLSRVSNRSVSSPTEQLRRARNLAVRAPLDIVARGAE